MLNLNFFGTNLGGMILNKNPALFRIPVPPLDNFLLLGDGTPVTGLTAVAPSTSGSFTPATDLTLI